MLQRSVLTFAACLASFSPVARGAATWPSSIDELEDLMFLNTGYGARGFAGPVTPCNSSPGNGRLSTAEWLRTAFHDMATGNIYQGTGGLDASIIFELGGDSPGPGFPDTLSFFSNYYTTKSSMADLIALGTYAAVRSCGGPIIPVKTGRIDATSPFYGGVPQPQNSLYSFQNQFLRMGFNATEMISLVACGHTMGSVKASNFPDIVPPGSAPPYDVVSMDGTPAYDTKIASNYVSGSYRDPLVSGPCQQATRCSDNVVFSSDGNATITAMTNPAYFQSTCQGLLQRFIELVPSNVVFTSPIVAYDVKPSYQLTLLDGGASYQFAGQIRVRTTVRPASQIASVQLLYAGGTITTSLAGTGAGFDDSFAFYTFSAQLPTSSSLSSFTVTVNLNGGGSETYNNNGGGFPVQDQVIFQSPQSCLSGSNLTVVAAVRTAQNAPFATLTVTTKVPRPNLPVPSLAKTTVSMAPQATVGPYILYSGSLTLNNQTSNVKFDVSIGSGASMIVDGFKNTASLGTTCKSLGAGGTSSSSSSSMSSTMSSTSSSASVSSSSSTSSSSSVSSSSSISSSSTSSSSISSSSTSSSSTSSSSMPSSTTFAYQGCFIDTGNPRALSGAASADNTMTVEECAASCSNFQYFGTEYGRECYCGNTRDSSSTQVSDSDCSFNCAGNAQEKCGAGNRLSLYRNLKYVAVTSPTIPGYTYQGCYNEVNGRALSDSSTSNSGMTVENCAAFCNGAQYFGVEYGQECYCGATLKAGSTQQPSTDCNMLCAGNSSEYCGAGGRLNLYMKGSAPTSSSTFSTVTTSSASTSSSSSSSSVASSTSSSTSSSKPSSSSSSSTSSAPSSTSSASSTSSSTSSKPSSTSSSTSSSISTTSSVTSSSISSTSASASAMPSFAGYAYQGCFVDPGNPRILAAQATSTPTMSYSACSAFCSNYDYFGVEYGSECYCDNSIGASATLVPDPQCSFACSGASSQKCGAGNRMNIFRANKAVPLPSNPAIQGYTYSGCWTDSGPRTLSQKSYADGANMTVESCASFCSTYKYFGTEYSRECYCGNTFNNPSATKVSDGNCSMTCTGNKLEFCGGSSRLTLYQANS